MPLLRQPWLSISPLVVIFLFSMFPIFSKVFRLQLPLNIDFGIFRRSYKPSLLLSSFLLFSSLIRPSYFLPPLFLDNVFCLRALQHIEFFRWILDTRASLHIIGLAFTSTVPSPYLASAVCSASNLQTSRRNRDLLAVPVVRPMLLEVFYPLLSGFPLHMSA